LLTLNLEPRLDANIAMAKPLPRPHLKGGQPRARGLGG
jgi:hypothetical protein